MQSHWRVCLWIDGCKPQVSLQTFHKSCCISIRYFLIVSPDPFFTLYKTVLFLGILICMGSLSFAKFQPLLGAGVRDGDHLKFLEFLLSALPTNKNLDMGVPMLLRALQKYLDYFYFLFYDFLYFLDSFYFLLYDFSPFQGKVIWSPGSRSITLLNCTSNTVAIA